MALAALLALATTPALALYKVVGPDGRVTYTDRAPADTNARITTLGPQGTGVIEVAAPDALPLALRQTAARYPVRLYTSDDCAPCDAGRQLLLQRGVPYAEKRIVGNEDAAELERMFGARTVPSLSIGTQALRGLSASEWNAFLDAAGYPRESRLPPNWQPPSPTVLVERPVVSAPSAPRAAAEPAAPPAPAPAPTANPPAGLRF
jgi:glutaredoxin